MSTIGTCRLCQTPQVALCASHIVPEFFYKRVYTRSHKFAVIAKDAEERLVIEQKGYRENLLCQNCETKLSKWEGKLSQLIDEITTDSYKSCRVSKIDNVTVLSGVDYFIIKTAILSIFWRMSVASHHLFSAYELGPYAEEFRCILDHGQTLGETKFPVLISKALLDGVFQVGVLFPVGRSRYDNNLIMQSVVLNGIVFDCIMTSTRAIPQEIIEFSLQPAGRVLIPSRSYEALGMDLGEFSTRMKNTDVKRFIQNYS